MKLPTEKGERTKLFIACAAGTVALVYGIYAGIVTPLKNHKLNTEDRIAVVKADVDTAETIIKRVTGQRGANIKTVAQIRAATIDSQYLVRPRLGNYQLAAIEIVDAAARTAAVEVVAINEVGLSTIPQHTGRKTPNAFRSYTLRVSLHAGVRGILAFLRNLEQANPYVCVSALSITVEPSRPEQHNVGFDIQWPAWASEETRNRFAREEPAGTATNVTVQPKS